MPAFSNCYDAVGNGKQITSTLAPVPAGLWNYDANDRFTAGDTYDADGNTVSSGGIANVYDFENHLIQKGGWQSLNRLAWTGCRIPSRSW
jgi:hypothetical protein